MDRQQHWETVYTSKKSSLRSWYRPHLETSLALIERFAPQKGCSLLDIGGGASTLVDDLLAKGYEDISVLDIAGAALEDARQRLGKKAEGIHWIEGDFLSAGLDVERYALCHDRAVFHFLIGEAERVAYLEQARRILRPDGVLVLATFAADGPERCSGLEVARYDEEKLRAAVGERFELLESQHESHHTPTGAEQKMMYFILRRTSTSSLHLR